MILHKIDFKLTSFVLFLLFSLSSCKKLLPENLDVFGDDTRFTQTVYKPILGRNVLMTNNFTPGNSTRPFDMKIINMRRADGSDATELTENFPVTVWNKAYLGTETSLEAIESKRSIEYHPLFSIREHSGQFLMWAKANSSFVSCAPDSGYTFDVEVQNSGGRRYFRGLRLIPQREMPYEPSVYDPATGIAPNSFVRPTSIVNYKSVSSRVDLTINDVKIFFNKDEDNTKKGNTLTFKFFDPDYHPIDPMKFNLTNWETLVHGFDMEKTSEYVRYKTAYPIPLIASPTKYTTVNGSLAHTQFSYDRLNSGGFREVANMVFDFGIYQEGNWEIVIVFSESPKFAND